MTYTSPITIDDFILALYGIQVIYVDDVPAENNTGFLDKSEPPTFIAVKRVLHPSEQVFTILHELGHLVMHRRPCPRPSNWAQRFLTHIWDNHYMAWFARAVRKRFHKQYDREFEADMFALDLMARFGRRYDLQEYLTRHPENTGWFLLLATHIRTRAIKLRLRKLVLDPWPSTQEKT